MPVRIRPTDLGIIYAAGGANSGHTYVDRKNVTQDYIELTSAYVEMTTVETGGVDTSKPFLDATLGMTLAVRMEFANVTEIKLRCDFRRADEVSDSDAWAPLQLVNQTSGTTASEQTIAGTTETIRVGLQTASEFTAGQIRVMAKYTAGIAPGEGDKLLVYCEAC